MKLVIEPVVQIPYPLVPVIVPVLTILVTLPLLAIPCKLPVIVPEFVIEEILPLLPNLIPCPEVPVA